MYKIVIHFAWLGLLLAVVACIVASSVYPLVLRMARVWRVFDCPDERKLQQYPVPVMGGVVVFCGMFITEALFFTCFPLEKYVILLVGMLVMLLVGVWDDVKNIPVWIRVAAEILVVTGLAYFGKMKIEQFGGLWGIYELNSWWSWGISIVAGIGLVNAINLIDGVDGYSSGYTMSACLMFASVFYKCDVYGLAILSMICAGAVFPFFLHNVFGKKTKMFIGDGGTLMIGLLIVGLTFSMLRKGSMCDAVLRVQYGVGLVPLCLSFLSIAVFDTLRVMFVRIVHGKSPFHPDRGHLHHLFIDYGFSPIGTTCGILCMNCMVVMAYWLSWLLGADVTVQLYVVVLAGGLATFGFYPFMRHQAKKGTKLSCAMARLGKCSHMGDTRFWLWMQKFVDDDLFSKGKI